MTRTKHLDKRIVLVTWCKPLLLKWKLPR